MCTCDTKSELFGQKYNPALRGKVRRYRVVWFISNGEILMTQIN